MCWEDHDVRVSRPFVCVCLSVRQVMMWRRILWLKQGRYEIVVPHVYQCTLTHVEVMSLYSCYLEDCEILKGSLDSRGIKVMTQHFCARTAFVPPLVQEYVNW